MTIDADIQAARAAEPGDLDAIRALALIMDDLAETQRVTRNLQTEAALALGRHLKPHPRAERAGLVPGFELKLERVTAKRYDSPMVRSRIAAVLADSAALVDKETGAYPPPAEIVRRTCEAVWPVVGAQTDGFSSWRSTALKRLGVDVNRYLVNEEDDSDDEPVKGRVIRLGDGQTSKPTDAEETP